MARAEADRLRAAGAGPAEQVVIDFAHYAAAAIDRQRSAPPPTGTTPTGTTPTGTTPTGTTS